MHGRAEELIRGLNLTPHPEGGYFKETHRSALTLTLPGSGARRNGMTDIFFLLVTGQVSRLHRVLHDEIWHFYEGDPLELVEIRADLTEVRRVVLSGAGSSPRYKHCVQGGNWQAAYSRGEYSLVGCTVAPGFDFADFEFMDPGVAGTSALFVETPELARLL